MLQITKRKRRYYTDAEKAEMWRRWRKGESINEIGRLFGIQGHSSIQKIFRRPAVPHQQNDADQHAA